MLGLGTLTADGVGVIDINRALATNRPSLSYDQVFDSVMDAAGLSDVEDPRGLIPNVQCSLDSAWHWKETVGNVLQSVACWSCREEGNFYGLLRTALLEVDRIMAVKHVTLTDIDRCVLWSSLEVRDLVRSILVGTGSESVIGYVERQLRREVHQALGRKPLSAFLSSLVTARDESSEQPMSAVATATEIRSSAITKVDANYVKEYLKNMALEVGTTEVMAVWVSRYLGYRSDSTMKRYMGTGARPASRAAKKLLDTFFLNNSPGQAVSLFNAKQPNWTEYHDNGKPVGIPKPKQSKKR